MLKRPPAPRSGFEVPKTSNFGPRTVVRLARPASLASLAHPPSIDQSPVLDSLPPMAPSPQHSTRKLSHKSSFFLALLCMVGTACSTTDQNTKILFEDPRGTVSLQTMSDRSIHATHPINLEPNLLAKILRGIEIQDQEHGIQKFLAGRSSPVPVFSDDQIRFLAPLLADGLRTAAPDQRIEYRVQTTHKGSMLESSTTETTAGSLYSYGVSLYFSLTQYRYAPTRTDTKNLAHGRLPDSTGLTNRVLIFTPSAAQRSENFHRPTGGASTDKYLAIDYQLLQHASPAAAATVLAAPLAERIAEPVRDPVPEARLSGTPSPAETLEARDKEIQTLKDLVIRKELELDSLRKELESTRKQLDSQKRKTPPQSKPQQAAP